MRWIWIDKFLEFESGKRALAIKCCTLSEEHLHDLFPEFPVVPHSLVIEGMAQTAGLLVGEKREYREKVILAKIGRATFHRLVRPGDSITFEATVDQLNDTGASISGRVVLVDGGALIAEIELMFSHIDNNLSGMKFPEHNFVFTTSFTELVRNLRSGDNVPF